MEFDKPEFLIKNNFRKLQRHTLLSIRSWSSILSAETCDTLDSYEVRKDRILNKCYFVGVDQFDICQVDIKCLWAEILKFAGYDVKRGGRTSF